MGEKMRKLILLLIVLSLLAGCAKRPEGASPDYQNYLAALDSIAAYEAQVDRTIFTLEVGSEPVTLPPGAKMMVRAPAMPLPLPQMYRDHAYEAELAYYGQVWSIVGGAAIPAIAGMYNNYNNRKMVLGIAKSAGGVTLNNAEGGQQHVMGNWGDINSYGSSGDTGVDFNLQPYEVYQPEPLVVEPSVVVVEQPEPVVVVP
jgi:hypothetical protein